jgi:hypothetical protein
MRKEEVYSWRVSTEMKAALERAAHREGKSIAQLLEQLVGRWLEKTGAGPTDEVEQRRLHQAAARWLGKFRGEDPGRSERVREVVRERLNKRRAG